MCNVIKFVVVDTEACHAILLSYEDTGEAEGLELSSIIQCSTYWQPLRTLLPYGSPGAVPAILLASGHQYLSCDRLA